MQIENKIESRKQLRLRIMRSLDDCLPFFHIFKEMHRESELGHRFEFDAIRVEKTIERMASQQNSTLMLAAEWDGELVGFTVCTVSSFISAGDALIGHIQFLYIAQSWRSRFVGGRALVGLAKFAIHWAQQKEVVEIRLEISNEMLRPKLIQLSKQLGFLGAGIVAKVVVK